MSIAGSRQKRRRADDADSVTDSDVEPEPPRRRKRNRVPAPLEDLSEDDMEMMGTLDSHALPRRNTAPASAPGPSAGPSGGRKSVGATPTADRRSRPQSAAQSPISQRPAQAPRAQRPPAFDTQFDRQMSEAPAPTNDGEREMDYDFAILSEGDVDDDWNDLVDQDVDLFDHKEFVKNTSPAKPPPGSAGRSNARGPTSSQPQEPRAVSFSQSQSRQQAAGRAAGPSQATENAPGRANAAGPSRRPPPPVRMPSNKEELFALVRKEDERAITAMHMAGGAVDIAIRLYRANLDVSALSTSDRRFVFTHDEDLLIQNYTDVAEIEDILKLHGATKFESRYAQSLAVNLLEAHICFFLLRVQDYLPHQQGGPGFVKIWAITSCSVDSGNAF